MMRIGIAADHGGFGLKQKLLVQLHEAGHEVEDFGAHHLIPNDDYPDFVIPLAQAVAAGDVDRGVLRRLGKVSALEAAGHVSIPRDSR